MHDHPPAAAPAPPADAAPGTVPGTVPGAVPRARLLDADPGRTDETVTLDYDARLIRRKVLTGDAGTAFLVDLPQVSNLDAAWGFALPDGRSIAIRPAAEAVLVVTGDLPRLAWHIGNRHTPCQIGPDRLVIREDHVLEGMLRGLGATIGRESLPFTPEGGAYGHGRTMGHSHGPDAGHGHGHGHGHHHD